MKKKFTLILVLTIIFACNNADSKKKELAQITELNIVKKHQKTLQLNDISLLKVKAWKEYQLVNNQLKKYKSISANEALNNAIELAKSIKQLKDSIRPKELINNSFRTRVNVLENEALRLKDMTLIKNAISSKEINKQVEKVLHAFSATNSKINTVYSQLEVEKEINLDKN
jgi:hypothetical protein